MRKQWTAGLFLGALFSSSVAMAELKVNDPWIAAAPPNAPAIGGFMLLKNTSDKPVSVVAVHGNVSKTIELHRTIFSEGMARMVPQPKLEVPANGELVLKPGDYHVMFIRPKALRVGDKVDLELELDDGSRVPLTAEVRPRPRGMKGHNHH